MLLDILRFVPLLEVLVVDSMLRSYIGFLDGLTYRSQEESILPNLTSFSLYVELDYFGRIYDSRFHQVFRRRSFNEDSLFFALFVCLGRAEVLVIHLASVTWYDRRVTWYCHHSS